MDQLGAVVDWSINRTLRCGSDHYALKFKLGHGLTEIDNIYGVKFNYKKADPEEWQTAFRTETLACQPDLDALQLDNPSTDQLEMAAIAYGDCLRAAMEAKVPVRKTSHRAKPWWTKELDEARTQMSEEEEDIMRQINEYGEANEYIMLRQKKHANYFKRQVKKAKKKWADDTLKDAKTKDIWGFHMWTTGRRTYPVPAISRGEGVPPAVQHCDKCNTIRDELFQPPPPLLVPLPDLTQKQEGDLDWTPLMRTEVRESVYGSDPNKAPGPSQVPALALRWAWEADSDTLYRLMYRCAEAGYHPRIWRRGIAAALRKPNKPDYSNPRAYRLIQLLEDIAKILERCIARRLGFLVAKHNLVPTGQFGGRPGSSTIDAALTFVHDVEAAKDHRLVTSALCFDIKGYFDFVNHPRLLTVLHTKGIPLPIVQWTAAFLEDRQVAVCLDGIRDEMKPVENGIPQGSPVSCILATLYTGELCEILETRAMQQRKKLLDEGVPTNLLQYVDDGKLYTSSLSLAANITELTTTWNITETWLKSAGLSPNFAKWELAHYSCRRDAFRNEPSLWLPAKDNAMVEVKASCTIKWLGIYFDRKLSFSEHRKRMAA